jgi:hypothetical protein
MIYFFILRQTVDLEYLDLNGPFRNHYDSYYESDINDEEGGEEDDEDSLIENSYYFETSSILKNDDFVSSKVNINTTSIQNEDENLKTSQETKVDNKKIVKILSKTEQSYRKLVTFLTSTSSFITLTSFIFGFLIKYLATSKFT